MLIRTFLVMVILILSNPLYAEPLSPKSRWIAVFTPALVDSCESKALLNRLQSLVKANQLALVRPFQNCGVVFTSDTSLDIKHLKTLPELDYIEPDGLNQHFK